MNEIVTTSFSTGLPGQFRDTAAYLYDEAFGEKLAVAVRSRTARLSLLRDGFVPGYAIVAIKGKCLVGIAGFRTQKASLTGGITYSALVSRLGCIRGNWAALILSLFERRPQPGELVMDGIVVDPAFRGQGIGSRLLDQVASYARQQGYQRVRLDVIDTNPRARLLYERKGFKETGTEKFAYLRWLLGFGGSTIMELEIENTQSGNSACCTGA